MRYIKSIITACLMGISCVSALAQSESCPEEGCPEAQALGYKPYPYNFIQVQGGVGTTFTDVSCWKLLNPTFSIGVGRMFSPIVGARLHVNGWESKGGFDALASHVPGMTAWSENASEFELIGDPLTYKYNYINTNADLMINVLNIFSSKVHRPFDLYLIGGLGINYAWNNDDFENVTSQYDVASDICNAWGDRQTPRQNLISHNLRLGVLADVNISKHWSIGAEVDFNSLDDRFNSKYTNSDDWMMTGQISLTYKFGFKKVSKPTPAKEPAPIQETKPVETIVPAAPAVKTEVVKEEALDETLFYMIRESDVNSDEIIAKVAEWCKKYPSKTITVEGYADKGTGNPTINAKYARWRAEKVGDALSAKGVSRSQMKISYYGDTVQPFGDNDKNRCVIIRGK